MLPAPRFHHLHLNSVDPDAAIDFYTRRFPTSAKTSWGGLLALAAPNNVLVLFTRVATAPATSPQTAIWHFGWHVPDTRRTLESYSLVDQVAATDEEILITRNGRPAAVLVSPDEFEGWRETQAIRSDPELLAEIRRGLRALRRGGKIYTLEELLPAE